MKNMSTNQKEIGAVVVGLGVAGKVRVRDINQQTNGLTLRGVISRRPVEIEDVTAMTIDEALSRDDVQAILVCTENAHHEEYVEKALNHKKHVLVEYPLALSSSKAKELHRMAEDKVVLWEENVALLTDFHLAVKAKVATSEIKSVSCSLAATFNGWLENFEQSGPPFISGISTIQTMVDLFGEDLNVLSASLTKGDDCYTTTAKLETKNHKPITLTLSRTADRSMKRTKISVYEFEDGEILDSTKHVSKPPTTGLFMQDLNGFYQAVLNGKTTDKARDLSIKSLEIAERIHSLF